MFENKYPYTDFHELNLDWIIQTVKDLEEKVDNVEADILNKANAYTDTQITERLANVQSQFDELKREVEAMVAGLDHQYDVFVATVNARMQITEARLNQINDRLDSILNEATQYTNFAINANNAYIIDQTTKALSTVTVLNYFTGARVSIQEMFDYLAHFHLTNAITAAQIANREKTCEFLVGLNMTMTDLATNGGTLIPV